jgi:flagellar capping protein FliD
VDLWKAAGRSPDDKLIRAVQKKLSDLNGQRPQSVTDKARSFLTKIGLSSAEMEGSIEPSVHLTKLKAAGKES